GTLSLSHDAIQLNGVGGTSVVTARGGGVYSSGTLTLDHVSISQNQAQGATSATALAPGGPAQGGALWNGGQLTISTSSVLANTVYGGTPPFPFSSGSYGDAQGGGIYNAG